MSLFPYKVRLTNGGEKEGKVTAKTEKEARERVANDNRVVDWSFIRQTPVPNAPKATPKTCAGLLDLPLPEHGDTVQGVQDGAANASQSIRSGTDRTSSVAGTRR